eukprot:CAMPEP_0175622078 /NCGR_PEP_ID=MMETSP0096-20121207/68744_1 /TAXON_ID=311494 /ORGANISM="Alexandrium monilatum, Strain CCMP3105" /LENGTH=57 /DNA_ID=CAMNT_0016927325 /DNA_START=40 /DNA_END=211 /DNA_ORIENTATION=-
MAKQVVSVSQAKLLGTERTGNYLGSGSLQALYPLQDIILAARKQGAASRQARSESSA